MTRKPGEAALALAAQPTSAREARAFVRATLVELSIPEPPLEDTVLLAGELVSNVVQHARTRMQIHVTRRDRVVRVEVHDRNTHEPRAASGSLDATSGRGLFLVENLASNWGVEPTVDGKAVWFEIRLS